MRVIALSPPQAHLKLVIPFQRVERLIEALYNIYTPSLIQERGNEYKETVESKTYTYRSTFIDYTPKLLVKV